MTKVDNKEAGGMKEEEDEKNTQSGTQNSQEEEKDVFCGKIGKEFYRTLIISTEKALTVKLEDRLGHRFESKPIVKKERYSIAKEDLKSALTQEKGSFKVTYLCCSRVVEGISKGVLFKVFDSESRASWTIHCAWKKKKKGQRTGKKKTSSKKVLIIGGLLIMVLFLFILFMCCGVYFVFCW